MPVRKKQRVLQTQGVVRAYEEGGLSICRIADILGTSRQAVRHRLRNAGVTMRQCTPRRGPIYTLIEMRAGGLLLREVGALLGIKEAAVCRRLARAGVHAGMDLSPVIRLTPRQRAVYIDALDRDRLDHSDALELALEWE